MNSLKYIFRVPFVLSSNNGTGSLNGENAPFICSLVFQNKIYNLLPLEGIFSNYTPQKIFFINFCYYFHEEKSLKKVNSLATEITML